MNIRVNAALALLPLLLAAMPAVAAPRGKVDKHAVRPASFGQTPESWRKR